MQIIFGTYDHLIIVYSVYVFAYQQSFWLVAMATFNFEKGLPNDNLETTAAVWLLFGTNFKIAKIMVFCLLVWLPWQQKAPIDL